MRSIFLTIAGCLCLSFGAAAQAPATDVQTLPASTLSAAVQQQASARWSVALAQTSGVDTVINSRSILSVAHPATGVKYFMLLGTNKSQTLKIASLLQRSAGTLQLYPSPSPESSTTICTSCGKLSVPQWQANMGWSCPPVGPNSGDCTKSTTTSDN